MDGSSFDTLTRFVGGANSRRTAMRTALAGATASALAAAGLALAGGQAEAKKKKKKKCKCKALDLGAACTTNKECCTNETNRLCAFFQGGSTFICCGGVGATCANSDQCCGDFTCQGGKCDS